MLLTSEKQGNITSEVIVCNVASAVMMFTRSQILALGLVPYGKPARGHVGSKGTLGVPRQIHTLGAGLLSLSRPVSRKGKDESHRLMGERNELVAQAMLPYRSTAFLALTRPQTPLMHATDETNKF